MAWTTPRTWQPGELVTATLLNAHLRDNLNTLFNMPITTVTYTKGSDYTNTSGNWVDVDATNLSGSITLNGSRLLVVAHLVGSCTAPAASWVGFDVALDGVRLGDSTYGLGVIRNGLGACPLTFFGFKTGLAAGAHSFKLQFRSAVATETVTATGIYPIRLLALEV